MHACFAGRRDSDTFDEVGHSHFNVEFDHVSEGVKLNVSVTCPISQLAFNSKAR